MNTRIKHIIGLAGTIAIPLLTVWGDASTDLAVKIAVTVSLLIPLVWSNPMEQAKVRTAILAGIPVVTIAVSFIFARMSQDAAGGAMLTVVIAAMTQLRRVLASQPGALPATVQPGGPTPVTVENPTGGQPVANRKP